jgi:cell division septum initiation protein DivIVA
MAGIESPNFEFQRRGGYDQSSVDSYIKKILAQMESLNSKVSFLEAELNKAQTQASSSSSELIELAQIITSARDMNIKIEEQANQRAAQIIEEAHNRAEQEYANKRAELEFSIQTLVKFELEMNARKNYIESQIDYIKQESSLAISELVNKVNLVSAEIAEDIFDPSLFIPYEEKPPLSLVDAETQKSSSLSFDDIFSDLGVEFDQ